MNIPPRKIINRDIYLFIYNLLKYIIYDEDKPEKKILKEKHLEKINLFISIYNEKINKKIEKYSNKEC